MAEEVNLFRTWSSSFALRVVWALKLKGIQYNTTLEDLSNKSPLLIQYNPVYKKVPVLVHNGNPVSESLIVLEYIDDTWKQDPPLLPQDPYQRATARFWAKFGDDKIMSSIWSAFKLPQGLEQEAATVEARENLKSLEQLLKGNKFFGGESIGFLDLALGWLANLISVFEEITGSTIIDEKTFPLLFKWMQDFSEVPVVKESWPPRDQLIVKFRALREPFLASGT